MELGPRRKTTGDRCNQRMNFEGLLSDILPVHGKKIGACHATNRIRLRERPTRSGSDSHELVMLMLTVEEGHTDALFAGK